MLDSASARVPRAPGTVARLVSIGFVHLVLFHFHLIQLLFLIRVGKSGLYVVSSEMRHLKYPAWSLEHGNMGYVLPYAPIASPRTSVNRNVVPGVLWVPALPLPWTSRTDSVLCCVMSIQENDVTCAADVAICGRVQLGLNPQEQRKCSSTWGYSQ